MSLYELGWTDDRNQELSIDRPLEESELSPARVVRQDRDRWLLDRGDGNATPAVLSGRLRHSLARTERPVVGDWVMIPNDPTADAAVIRRVLSRRSRLARASGEGSDVEVLAANVDTTLVVCGLDRDFNLRRVERYLTLAWGGGTVPVVLLNKADLCGELDERLAAAVAAAPGAEVHPVSALQGEGLDTLAPHLVPGRTVALLGSSGAGKSTLVNRLLGRDLLPTAPVRADDDRGRHTTTRRELLRLPGGACLVDTPGLREVAPSLDGEDLDLAFPEVERLADRCRYRDCRHDGEPGCAVQAALAAGELDPGRVRGYTRLQRELAFLDRRLSASGRREERERERAFGRMARQTLREVYRRKGGGG